MWTARAQQRRRPDAKEGHWEPERKERVSTWRSRSAYSARWQERYKRPMWTARAQQWRRLDAKEGHREPWAQRARLDLNNRPARWQERYKRPMGTARAQRQRRSDVKEGIENRQRTTSASRDTSYVWTARAQRRRGPTPKRALITMSASRASRLVRPPCAMARAVRTSYVDGESKAVAAAWRQRRASRTANAKSSSRLEQSPRTMARAVETSNVDGENTATAAVRRQKGHREPSAHNERVSTWLIALHDS